MSIHSFPDYKNYYKKTSVRGIQTFIFQNVTQEVFFKTIPHSHFSEMRNREKTEREDAINDNQKRNTVEGVSPLAVVKGAAPLDREAVHAR